MKIFIKVVFIGLIIACFSNLILAEEYDFRKTKWGMSVAQVKASESLDIVQEDKTLLAYQTRIISKDVYLLYTFVNNQLVRARYWLNESHTNKNCPAP